MCCITFVATTMAAPTHAAPGPEPLTVTKVVPSDRAPWPNHTLVLAWMDRDGGRLYPLPLLDRYGVLLDERGGRRVAATWSADTGTATLLALPGVTKVASSQVAVDGWRRVRDPVSASEWLPGKPLAVTGPSTEQLWPVPETAIMPLRLARRLAPTAQIPISNDPPAVLNAGWQRTRKRTLIPTMEQRLTVVLAREDAAAWRLDALPPHGLVKTEIGGLAVLVVRAHRVSRAFMAPMTPTGAPWLWTERVGLWNGLTGQRLDDRRAATQALAVIELSEAAFRTHWSGGIIHGR
ncbi:MAG: hypothetical protein QF464_10435 [Myxococcota bacterium]|nr:hypothetical protein [Myxococcota bacterium]